MDVCIRFTYKLLDIKTANHKLDSSNYSAEIVVADILDDKKSMLGFERFVLDQAEDKFLLWIEDQHPMSTLQEWHSYDVCGNKLSSFCCLEPE